MGRLDLGIGRLPTVPILDEGKPVIRLDLTISNQKGTPARNPSAELKLEEGAKTRGVGERRMN